MSPDCKHSVDSQSFKFARHYSAGLGDLLEIDPDHSCPGQAFYPVTETACCVTQNFRGRTSESYDKGFLRIVFEEEMINSKWKAGDLLKTNELSNNDD